MVCPRGDASLPKLACSIDLGSDRLHSAIGRLPGMRRPYKPGAISMRMAGPFAMTTQLGLRLLVFSSARFCSIIAAGATYQVWRGSG